MQRQKAKLILEDGSAFKGSSFGAENPIAGEVVFNTGMVGYPESFTDPSYSGQILALTYPLIGNYGVPGAEKDSLGIIRNFESERIHIKGLIVSDYSSEYNHWQATRSLADWLKEHDIPGVSGIDTRALTKKLRKKGVMLGKIVFDKDLDFYDPNKENLVDGVSLSKPKTYGEGAKTVVLFDCGAKHSIIRSLVQRDLKVVRVPWDHDISNMECDGIFVSSGPGDPTMATATVKSLRKAMKNEIPIMGICLGNLLLALAAGANTYKLKYGHRSQNQPCIDTETKRCYITSQNHGYAVDAKTLPAGWKEWFVNANDNTNEGIRHRTKPFMSCQFHPEANPGPVDTAFLFDRFKAMLR
jgi:carbamoyl-phosphate synthase small subunit